jgi:tetratricopeptide (TPR) repeat protein
LESIISSNDGADPLVDRSPAAIAAVRAIISAALKRHDLAAAAIAVARLATLRDAAGGTQRERGAAQAELADLWTVLLDYPAAARCYARAVELVPSESRYWFNRAAVRRFVGELEGAEGDYDQAIVLDPRDAQAYLNRSELRVQSAERNHLGALQRALAAAPAGWRYEVPLRYALAKEHEDLGDFAAAWQHLSAGTTLRRRNLQYDIRADLATVDWIREAFPVGARFTGGSASEEPIFIVGMPRTGSTLVDRILGSHSDVFSAGELPDFAAVLVGAVQQRLGRVPPRQELIAASATLDFTQLGEAYLRRTRPRTGGTRYFTDKMPLNYLYCGIIARALPRAKIIHVTRHPLANCYGMYKVLFDRGYPFSYDLAELADYYLGYRRLMAHWQAALPDRIIEIAYEDLVARSELVTPRLLQSLGLPWQASCLEFHDNPAPVATASAAQVRRPIYTSAVAAWRNYEQQLAPLAARLRAAGVRIAASAARAGAAMRARCRGLQRLRSRRPTYDTGSDRHRRPRAARPASRCLRHPAPAPLERCTGPAVRKTAWRRRSRRRMRSVRGLPRRRRCRAARTAG